MIWKAEEFTHNELYRSNSSMEVRVCPFLKAGCSQSCALFVPAEQEELGGGMVQGFKLHPARCGLTRVNKESKC